DRPGRIGKLIVKYQWKPPQCSHCKTFGHYTSACKVRPRTENEVAAKVLKEALKVDKDSYVKVGGDNNDNDVFVEVGKKNKPMSVQSGLKYNGLANVVPALKKSVKPHDDREGIVHKPPLNSKYSADFQPKVLVRGSGSNKQMGDKDEDIHVKNSFQVLEDHEMKDKEDCFLNSVHDEYKNVLDFFYNNCSKYGIEPYLEDDDVESNDEGMVMEMKSGMDIGGVPNVVNDGTNSINVINES
ncbi:hypothetical protein Tco_1232817, partial [Tanacetum coccineum]